MTNEHSPQSILENKYGMRAVGPGLGGYNFTRSEWSEWIEVNLPEFKGNKKAAGKLMRRIARGIREDHERYLAEGNQNFPIPNIYIATRRQESIGDSISYYNEPENTGIVIPLNVLNMITPEILEKIITMQAGSDQAPAYRGILLEFYELAAVEEHSHAKPGDTPPGFLDPYKVPLAHYDALEKEYRGLIDQRAHALAHPKRYSSEVVDILNTRIANATAIRASEKTHL